MTRNDRTPGAASPGPLWRCRRSTALFLHLLDGFNRGLLIFLSLCLGALATLGFAQVIWRYLLNQPLVWSEELVRYGLIWIVFLGGGLVIRKGQLAAVEFFSHSATPRIGRLISIAASVIGLAFWFILLFYGLIVMDAVQGLRSGALEAPMPLIYSAVPLGAFIALLNTLACLIDPPPAQPIMAD